MSGYETNQKKLMNQVNSFWSCSLFRTPPQTQNCLRHYYCFSPITHKVQRLNYVLEFCLNAGGSLIFQRNASHNAEAFSDIWTQGERFATSSTEASTLDPGLFLLRQYVGGKHHNGAYFHSRHAAANPVCHQKPPLSPLSRTIEEDN